MTSFAKDFYELEPSSASLRSLCAARAAVRAQRHRAKDKTAIVERHTRRNRRLRGLSAAKPMLAQVCADHALVRGRPRPDHKPCNSLSPKEKKP